MSAIIYHTYIIGFDKSNTDASWFDKNGNLLPKAAAVDYFSQMLLYTQTVKAIVTTVSDDIEDFVQLELERFNQMKQIPLILMIALAIFIPVVAYVTLQATSSMFKYELFTFCILRLLFYFDIMEYF